MRQTCYALPSLMAFFATSLLLFSGRAVGQLTVIIGMIKDPFLFIANKTKSQKSYLSPGRHAFQFSFRIPPYSLPSSFESKYGYVRYWIKARIHRRWRFDEVAKEMLNILSVVDVNCPRMLVRHTHMLYSRGQRGHPPHTPYSIGNSSRVIFNTTDLKGD